SATPRSTRATCCGASSAASARRRVPPAPWCWATSSSWPTTVTRISCTARTTCWWAATAAGGSAARRPRRARKSNSASKLSTGQSWKASTTDMITFLILAAVMVIGAVGVITLRQPIHAALALVGTLLALAVTYITLEAHFLGAIQVIVYAGAIMVLFLFVIMLLNVDAERPGPRWPWLRPVAFGVGLLGAAALAVVIFTDGAPLPAAAVISDVLQGGSAERIGTVLFSDYLLAFQD